MMTSCFSSIAPLLTLSLYSCPAFEIIIGMDEDCSEPLEKDLCDKRTISEKHILYAD